MNNTKQSLEMNLKQAEKRAYQHWYQDGLAETAVGIFFLLIGLLFFVEYGLGGGNISAFGLPILVLGGVFALAPIVRRLKARFTYSRTGYVSYNEPTASRRWLALGIGLALGVAIVILLAFTGFGDGRATLMWLPLAQAAVLAIFLGFMAYRFGLLRYYFLAAISLLAGAVVVAVQLGEVVGTAVYFTLIGLALIIAGLATLRNFLKQTKPYQEDG